MSINRALQSFKESKIKMQVFDDLFRPVSLLNSIFNHLREINFLTACQSGFLPGDSTVNQLIYLYDKICSALDNGLEIRMVFFDISKAFDKVWHKGFIFKLQV